MEVMTISKEKDGGGKRGKGKTYNSMSILVWNFGQSCRFKKKFILEMALIYFFMHVSPLNKVDPIIIDVPPNLQIIYVFNSPSLIP